MSQVSVSIPKFNVQVQGPNHDEGKLHRLLEGPSRIFPGNASLTQFFSTALAEGRIQPDKIALIHDEKRVSFGELEETSSRIASAIRDAVGGTPNQNPDGDPVIAICIPPSLKLIYTIFGIEKVGAAYLPIDPSFPDERVSKIVKDCRPLLIICDHHEHILNKFEHVKDLVQVLSTEDVLNGNIPKQMPNSSEEDDDEETEEAQQIPSQEAQQTPSQDTPQSPAQDEEVPEKRPRDTNLLDGNESFSERMAIILYTSGSSGTPKGVRLSHRTVMNRLSWQWNEFPFEADEICAFKTSLTFVDSVPEIFGTLLQGCPLVIFDKAVTSQPPVFMEKLSLHKITRITVVPSLLRAIFQTVEIVGRYAGLNLLKSVRLWICSGEPFSADMLDKFFELFPRKYSIANFYGSTEIMGDVTYVAYETTQDAFKKALDNKVPIGVPVYNTVVYVLDEEMKMAQFGEMGEIYICGYNLASSYVGGNNAEKFVANDYTQTPAFQTLYRTGDYGRIDNTRDGTKMLFYEGRVDSQIKVRGQRIDLAEVELALAEINLIKKAVVLCYKPGEADQTILAFVVPAEPDVTVDRLNPMIEKKLREYERPLIKLIEAVPLLVNGKTDRQRLLKMYESELENREEFEDWGTLDFPEENMEIAKTVLKVMSQVTGTSVETLVISLDNSFFNVGGTSLNAVLVVVKLKENNLALSVADFANAKNIREAIMATVSIEGEEGKGDAAFATAGDERYVITPLGDVDRGDAIHTIAYSFAKRGDLEAYTKSSYEEFSIMISSIWRELVDKGFSFIARRRTDGQCVGTSLNFDIYDEPENIETSQGIGYCLDLLDFIESRQRMKLPKGRGKLLHSFMMGTHDDVPDAESVAVIETMEKYILQMAAENKFMGVMTTNTNPLTKQIGLDINGYEVLYEYQVNKYVAPDGQKPFLLAPDSFTIVCCWKLIPGHAMELF